MKRSTRIFAWIAGVLVLSMVVIVIVAATFDWNRAKPYVNAKVSDALDRPFAIAGDLALNWRRDAARGDWLPGPVFTATDIVIDNPEWTRAKQFAHLDRIEFRLSLLPLLFHRIDIPAVWLGKPTVHLEKQSGDRNNWTFTPPDGGSHPSTWKIDVGEIGFDAGKITLHAPADRIDVNIDIDPLGKPIPFADVMATVARKGADEVAVKSTQAYAFGFKASGTYNGARVSGTGKTGGLLSLRGSNARFPLQSDLRIGDVRIALTGTITDPAAFGAIDLQLRLAGNSMAHLYPILGLPLPNTPPFETDGHLTGELRHKEHSFTYNGFNGKVGGSDLHGTLTYSQREPRPKLTGKVWSNQLLFADLGPLIGVDTGDLSDATKATPPGGNDGPRQPRDGRILPDKPFRTDRWKVMDADVGFNGKRIVHGGDLPLSDLQVHLKLEAGALALEPMTFGLAGGEATSVIRLDGRSQPMKGEIKLGGRNFKLSELFPRMQTMQAALGEVNADLALSATGNSIAALLGSSNGQLKLLMHNGVVSRELMELAGLNVGNYVVVKLFGDEPVNINCAATDFVASNGLMEARLAMVDTENALINIDGTISLAEEQIDLDITPHTKGLRIFSLRSPLYVKGTFGNPDVGVHVGKLLLRGGGAIALGVFATPAAALLPLIAPSKDKNANPCADLLAKMRGDAKAPRAGKAAS